MDRDRGGEDTLTGERVQKHLLVRMANGEDSKWKGFIEMTKQQTVRKEREKERMEKMLVSF